MHWTRQQRRLIYLVLSFFFMSHNLLRFLSSIFSGSGAYVNILLLLALGLMGLHFKQECLPWQVPIYFGLLRIIPQLPLEKLCRSKLSLFTLALLIIFSFIYLALFKKEALRDLFIGDTRKPVEEVNFVKNWFQAALLFVVAFLIWSFIRGPLARGALPYISLDLLVHSFLAALYSSLAIFAIPIAFSRGLIDKEELLVGLALGFGFFEKYFLIGSFIGTLVYLAIGWLFARASYETRGSFLTTLMLFVYFLGSLI